MLRFLYYTDIHSQKVSPKSRKDDFFIAIMNKLAEIGELIQEFRVSAALCGGDIFNRPDPPPSLVAAIGHALISWGVPSFTAIGNHDVFGYNPETAARTMLGILMTLGIVQHLERDKSVVFSDPANPKFKVGITGADSTYLLDKGGRIEDYYPGDLGGNRNIHIVHGFLSPNKRLDNIPHTLIEDILGTTADIILTGHDHVGFGVIRRNGKIFCNPGALGRVSAAVGEINRDVQVALIQIDDANNYDVRLIPIKCAKPADEVLDREEIEKEKTQKEQMAVFAQSITNFEVKTTDILEIMDLIAEQENIQYGTVRMTKAVINEARNRITKANIALGGTIDNIGG